ncbi:hypothetical protein M5K25_021038 [Dendrobium thyrsiflorum]|uniref:BED-type domain-containing protein n=1 Tax=Dendrobium thyrsiflorum TaxID=117978 RepID=A0ABD0UBD8_DENTH
MSSTAGGSGLGEGSKESCVETDNLLWNHVTKLGKPFEGGGNVSFKCNYCGGIYKGSYSMVKAHLLKIGGHRIKMCPKITTSQVDEAEFRIKRLLPKEIPLSSIHGSSHTSSSSVRVDHLLSFRSKGYESKKRKGVGSSSLEKTFNMQQREELKGYVPLGYNAIRSKLLERERAYIETLLQPTKEV